MTIAQQIDSAAANADWASLLNAAKSLEDDSQPEAAAQVRAIVGMGICRSPEEILQGIQDSDDAAVCVGLFEGGRLMIAKQDTAYSAECHIGEKKTVTPATGGDLEAVSRAIWKSMAGAITGLIA